VHQHSESNTSDALSWMNEISSAGDAVSKQSSSKKPDIMDASRSKSPGGAGDAQPSMSPTGVGGGIAMQQADGGALKYSAPGPGDTAVAYRLGVAMCCVFCACVERVCVCL
jgi:hypothetical protein